MVGKRVGRMLVNIKTHLARLPTLHQTEVTPDIQKNLGDSNLRGFQNLEGFERQLFI